MLAPGRAHRPVPTRQHDVRIRRELIGVDLGKDCVGNELRHDVGVGRFEAQLVVAIGPVRVAKAGHRPRRLRHRLGSTLLELLNVLHPVHTVGGVPAWEAPIPSSRVRRFFADVLIRVRRQCHEEAQRQLARHRVRVAVDRGKHPFYAASAPLTLVRWTLGPLAEVGDVAGIGSSTRATHVEALLA